MKNLMDEIRDCLIDLSGDIKAGVTARFLFPAGFLGFQGHFPDKPVLPGVCYIEAVMVIVHKLTGARPKLKKIKSAKFFAAVTHNEEITFNCRSANWDDEQKLVRTTVLNSGQKTAEMQMLIAFEDFS